MTDDERRVEKDLARVVVGIAYPREKCLERGFRNQLRRLPYCRQGWYGRSGAAFVVEADNGDIFRDALSDGSDSLGETGGGFVVAADDGVWPSP